jgi:L,D-peptidoglycan transpeptidase YkuD (ErfK/YbiS/YcfS/YnhG family)
MPEVPMRLFLFLLLTRMSIAEPVIPPRLAKALPPECSQVLLTLANDPKATTGLLWRMERKPAGPWKPAGAAIPVSLGRHGLAWGLGEHDSKLPRGLSRKKEGDGCSPIGVFALPLAFGSLAKPRGLRLPYLRCTSHHLGIDDPRSQFYNQIVDARQVACDWVNPETMIPSNGCYALGAVIPTSGCTAMSLDHVRLVLRWLDPAKQPRLVQGIEGR